MLSVSSSSSTPMLGWPALDEAMPMYSYSINNNNGFYDHSNQEILPTGYDVIDHAGKLSQVGDQIDARNGDAKKVNHNASERHRRKKINELYSSLRSLLPASEQSRRMSIPTTVAKVLKYIPELQAEVERMEKRKQTMSNKIHQNQEQVMITSQSSSKQARSELYKQEIISKGHIIRKKSNLSNVSTSKVGDKEVVIQVSTSQISIPEMLMSLEEEGFQLVTCFSSSSDSSLGARVFLNLHLQKPYGVEKMECEVLDQKLLSMLGKK